MSDTPGLFDERSRPNFSDRFRELARTSSDIATAITRVRLTTLDLTAADFEKLEHYRVLVAELNALTLDSEARLISADVRRAPRVDLFRELIESGRLEVRAAPLGGWSPDFTVFSEDGGPRAVLVGYHWLEHPFPLRGPALAAIHGTHAAERAALRHAELWAQAHDVGPALWSILSKARARPTNSSAELVDTPLSWKLISRPAPSAADPA
ncbi:MAG: hypothetical protein AAF389_18120 [Gemmatimonadota bacterium]